MQITIKHRKAQVQALIAAAYKCDFDDVSIRAVTQADGEVLIEAEVDASPAAAQRIAKALDGIMPKDHEDRP